MTPTECLTELETRMTARFTPSLNTASALEALILVAETIREMKAEVEAQSRSGEGATPPQEYGVTRIEVIDETGRVYTRWRTSIQLSYQDEGRTLKIFVKPSQQPQAEPGDEIAR